MRRKGETYSRIKQLLAERGLRSDWFAGQLGIERSAFEHMLAGRRKPSPHFYEKCAALLNVPVSVVKSDPLEIA